MVFSDYVAAGGCLSGKLLVLDAHGTAAGTAIPAKDWHVRSGEEGDCTVEGAAAVPPETA